MLFELLCPILSVTGGLESGIFRPDEVEFCNFDTFDTLCDFLSGFESCELIKLIVYCWFVLPKLL